MLLIRGRKQGEQVVKRSTPMAIQVFFSHFHPSKGLAVSAVSPHFTRVERSTMFIEVCRYEDWIKPKPFSFHGTRGNGSWAPSVADVNRCAVPKCRHSLKFSLSKFLLLHRIFGLEMIQQAKDALTINGLQSISRIHSGKPMERFHKEASILNQQQIFGMGEVRACLFDFRHRHRYDVIGLRLNKFQVRYYQLLYLETVSADMVPRFLNLALIGGQEPNCSSHVGWMGRSAL